MPGWVLAVRGESGADAGGSGVAASGGDGFIERV